MSAINGSAGYAEIVLTPNLLFDFSHGGSVTFDLSTEKMSTRDWWDLTISPFNQSLALPLLSTLSQGVDLNGTAMNAIHIGTDNGEGAPILRLVKNGAASCPGPCDGWAVARANANIPGSVNQAAARQPFKLTIANGRMKFERLASDTAPAVVFWDVAATASFNVGVVQWAEHSYTPSKCVALPFPISGSSERLAWATEFLSGIPRPDVGVLGTSRVAALADSRPLSGPGIPLVVSAKGRAPDIYSMGDRFQVIGANAVPNAAQVVNLQTVGYLPVEQHPADAVSVVKTLTTDGGVAVSVGQNVSRPQPTSIGEINLAPEAFGAVSDEGVAVFGQDDIGVAMPLPSGIVHVAPVPSNARAFTAGDGTLSGHLATSIAGVMEPTGTNGAAPPILPQASPCGSPATWHLDNLDAQPSTTFGIVHTSPRATSGGTVTFDSPAPVGAMLRFSAICKPVVNGVVLSRQPSALMGENYHAEHFSSYSVPVPVGSTSASVSFVADDWYSGPCLLKGATIWSLNAAPPPPTSTPTVIANTPTATATAPATATPTSTRTPVPPTSTSIPTSTPTASATNTPIPTATRTATPTATLEVCRARRGTSIFGQVLYTGHIQNGVCVP